MWMPVCFLCIFSFPQATRADVDEVRRAIESYYAQQKQPWSEVAGPYASVRLRLLTPASGVADVVLTRLYGGAFKETTRVRVVVLKTKDSDWRVRGPVP